MSIHLSHDIYQNWIDENYLISHLYILKKLITYLSIIVYYEYMYLHVLSFVFGVMRFYMRIKMNECSWGVGDSESDDIEIFFG